MVKLFCIEHVFRHSWKTVTAAFWRKYPNPLADHVKEVDCYDRKVDPITGILVTNRIITCQSAIPRWMQSLGIPSMAYAAETTIVDPVSKQMIVKSRNITGSSLLVIEETCHYFPHPENDAWTSYRQEAKISAFMPVVCTKFENHSLASIREKSALGLQAIETLSQRIQAEGALAVNSLIDNFAMFADNVSVSAANVVSAASVASASLPDLPDVSVSLPSLKS